MQRYESSSAITLLPSHRRPLAHPHSPLPSTVAGLRAAAPRTPRIPLDRDTQIPHGRPLSTAWSSAECHWHRSPSNRSKSSTPATVRPLRHQPQPNKHVPLQLFTASLRTFSPKRRCGGTSQLLEGLQELAERQTCALQQLWLAPAPCDPSELPTPDPPRFTSSGVAASTRLEELIMMGHLSSLLESSSRCANTISELSEPLMLRSDEKRDELDVYLLSLSNDKPSLPIAQLRNHAGNWPRLHSSQVPSMRMTHQSAVCSVSQSAAMINDNQELGAAGSVREHFGWEG
ncbi:hypothetical protein EYF80_026842 [Liparis tanakae]|uniref:Uncharacterized protein n=1 Tax=Liparis tanakae TaxID=230148 RepID=A0A4Z2HDU6_9TELE|nr:hypothetical protein EYF80_026842 [Liparis tanakae]